MTKQEYNIRIAALGLSSAEVAAGIGCSATQLSTALNPLNKGTAATVLRGKIDEYTLRLLNGQRAAVEREISDSGLWGKIQVVLPADNRIAIFSDGEFVGFYNPITKKIGM
ncbi:MAG: hypothetical protein E7589_01420 [Ruminococcaceae bacterium]|nr:hypothetical protein [Oscillospiraceae bacterium]